MAGARTLIAIRPPYPHQERDAAREAFEYARHRGIPVQVNNPHVREDIEAGIIDVTGVQATGPGPTVTVQLEWEE